MPSADRFFNGVVYIYISSQIQTYGYAHAFKKPNLYDYLTCLFLVMILGHIGSCTDQNVDAVVIQNSGISVFDLC